MASGARLRPPQSRVFSAFNHQAAEQAERGALQRRAEALETDLAAARQAQAEAQAALTTARAEAHAGAEEVSRLRAQLSPLLEAQASWLPPPISDRSAPDLRPISP